MLNQLLIADVHAPPSSGAGTPDDHTFGVGEWVRVPQHSKPRQIVAVFMGTKEPFYTFRDGYGVKGWSETVLLALNPSAGIVLHENAEMPEITPTSPVIDVLASTPRSVPETAPRAFFTPQPGIAAQSFNVVTLYPVVLPDYWLPAPDAEPDTAAIDDAAIERDNLELLLTAPSIVQPKLAGGAIVYRPGAVEYCRVLDTDWFEGAELVFFKMDGRLHILSLACLEAEICIGGMTVIHGTFPISEADAAALETAKADPRAYMKTTQARQFGAFVNYAAYVLRDAPLVLP